MMRNAQPIRTGLLTALVAGLVSAGFATAASAQSFKAYKSSGSLVFQTDGGSVSNSRGATIGKIEGNSYYSSGGSLKARLEDGKLEAGERGVRFIPIGSLVRRVLPHRRCDLPDDHHRQYCPTKRGDVVPARPSADRQPGL